MLDPHTFSPTGLQQREGFPVVDDGKDLRLNLMTTVPGPGVNRCPRVRPSPRPSTPNPKSHPRTPASLASNPSLFGSANLIGANQGWEIAIKLAH